MRRLFLLTAMGVFCIGTALAADLPRAAVPGDGTVNGAAIVAYDNAWSVLVRAGDGTVLHNGVATDHVAFRMVDGRRWLQRVEGQVDDDGAADETSITLSDPVTLAPYAGETHGADGSVIRRRFDGTHLTVRTTAAPGAAETVQQFELSQPVFDFRGNMAGLLLHSQRLAAGYAARIPWADASGVVHLSEIHVLRRETIAAGMKGRIATWVVAIGTPPAHTTYWIADRAPYVIRCEIASPTDVTIWQMIR